MTGEVAESTADPMSSSAQTCCARGPCEAIHAETAPRPAIAEAICAADRPELRAVAPGHEAACHFAGEEAARRMRVKEAPALAEVALA